MDSVFHAQSHRYDDDDDDDDNIMIMMMMTTTMIEDGVAYNAKPTLLCTKNEIYFLKLLRCCVILSNSWQPLNLDIQRYWVNKANLRNLVAATGLVILLKLDSNLLFFGPYGIETRWMNKRHGNLGSSAAILTNEMSNKHLTKWMSGVSFMKVRWEEHGKLDQ